jgi:hypothetical protein
MSGTSSRVKNPVLDGYQEQTPRSPGKFLRFITVVLQRTKYTVLRYVIMVLRYVIMPNNCSESQRFFANPFRTPDGSLRVLLIKKRELTVL